MNDEELINAVKNFPLLYNNTLKDYRNNVKKNSAWKQISESIGDDFGNKFSNPESSSHFSLQSYVEICSYYSPLHGSKMIN